MLLRFEQEGFDHTVSKGLTVWLQGAPQILGLNPSQTANAVAISGNSLQRLAGDQDRKIVTLERACLPESGCLLLLVRQLLAKHWYYGSARGN